MKKLGTLMLTVTLTGALSVGALASSEIMPISANPTTGYATAITVNGQTLNTAALPAAHGIPMRLVAESDHGSASWYEEEGTSTFYMDGCYITVTFATGAVAVNDKVMEGVTAEVKNGVTFLPATLFDGMEGYTMKHTEGAVALTTPNNDPIVKLGYEIIDASQSAARTKATGEDLTPYGIDVKNFSSVVGFFSFNISPDAVIVGKLSEQGDIEAVKTQLEAYRKTQEDTFSWYLSQNLPKVQNAKVVVENGYVLFLIAEDADKGVTAFQTWANAQ